MGSTRMKKMLSLVGYAAVVLMAGCTTYVTSQVTAFQNWPGNDSDRTYAFVRSPAQNNLEQSSYEHLVTQALSNYGFQQTSATQARYGVALNYGINRDVAVVPQPIYYNPPPVWYGRRWGWGPYYGPIGPVGYVNQVYPVFNKYLSLRFTEQASHQEVYSVTARTSGPDDMLLDAMPYLVHSALYQFPLPNAANVRVRLPVPKTPRHPSPQTSNEQPVTPASAITPAGAAQ